MMNSNNGRVAWFLWSHDHSLAMGSYIVLGLPELVMWPTN